MPEQSIETPWSSHSLFFRGFLSIYDWLALGFCCRFIWHCRSGYILRFYNQHVSVNHLDIGAGTGYFLDKCHFPVKHPRLVIIDINPRSLAMAQRRLKRYHPRVYRRDVLEPLSLEERGFDSISVTHLLHCLPGNMEAKGAVFRHILPLLNPGGVVFGSTFLYQGIHRSIPASLTFRELIYAAIWPINRIVLRDWTGLLKNISQRAT